MFEPPRRIRRDQKSISFMASWTFCDCQWFQAPSKLHAIFLTKSTLTHPGYRIIAMAVVANAGTTKYALLCRQQPTEAMTVVSRSSEAFGVKGVVKNMQP